jgi:O-Antigen ligase/Tetratricopeptide repeat
VMVGAGPQRLRRLAVGVGAAIAALPSTIVVFGLHDLSTAGLALEQRSDDGAVLGLVLVLSLVALGFAGRAFLSLEQRSAWGPRQRRLAWRGLGAAAAVALLVGIGALAASSRGLSGQVSHQWESFKEPKAGPQNTPDRLISANGSNRWIWWEEALGAFSDKPLAGWGAGSFPVVRRMYLRYETPVRSTHSLPLQFLSETGLIGAALGLGGLGLLGVAAVRRVRSSSGVERSARLALVACAAAWAVHSLVDWDWEIPALTVPALVAVGVAAAPSPREPRSGRGLPAPAALAGVAALAATLIAASAVLPTISDSKRLEALRDAGEGSLREATADADFAQKLNPLSVEPLFVEANMAQIRGDNRRAAALLTEATELAPDNYKTWQRLAQMQLAMGEYAAAARSIRRQAETNPLQFAVRPNVGDLLYPLEVPVEQSPTAFGTPPP